MSHEAAFLQSKGSKLSLASRPTPLPGSGQVLIRNHAIAINPVDWKMPEFGILIQSYPTVIGSDVAGTIEKVGDNVTKFQPGDRVSGFSAMLVTGQPDEGAFQAYTVVNEHVVARLPQGMSFEEGATLPMAVGTAGSGTFGNLKVPRTKSSGGFLVWGASGSVGSAVVQIAASMGYTVFAICSKRNFDAVKKIGATAAFDYKEKTVVEDVVAAAKSTGTDVKFAYDAISEQGSAPQAAAILDAFGGGKLCVVVHYPPDAPRYDKVEISHVFALNLVSDEKELGGWLFNDWLQTKLQDGSYKISPEVQIVGKGLGSLQEALEVLKQGVSGKKLVVPLA